MPYIPCTRRCISSLAPEETEVRCDVWDYDGLRGANVSRRGGRGWFLHAEDL